MLLTVLGFPVDDAFTVFVQFAPLQIPYRNKQGLLVKSNSACKKGFRARELCVKVEVAVLGTNSPRGLCGRKVTWNLKSWCIRAQKLCESRGGRP